MHGILALFIRSLREQVRGTSFAWMRAGMATAVLLTLMLYKQRAANGAVGLDFFYPFACYNAAMIIVAAISYFASAITEEKDEQTLGLLRMTDLSVLAILFGKSTSRMASGLMLLTVQFPFALLAVTLGGMSWEQVAIIYALLCAFLFFAANLGLLASVIAKNSGKAGLLTGILGFLYLGIGLPFAILKSFAEYVGFDTAATIIDDVGRTRVALAGPHAFFEALSINWGNSPWKETIVTFAISGTIAFLLAWACFGRFARDEAGEGRRTEKRGKLGWLRPRAGRAWQDGVAWKDFHFMHGGWRTFWIKVAVYTWLTVWTWSDFSKNRWYDFEYFMWLILAASIVVTLIETAFAVSRIYRLEQRWQTLGSIYLLPRDLNALGRSKRRALLLSLMPAMAFLIISFIYGIPRILSASFDSGEGFLAFSQMAVIIPLEVILHYRLVVWFSLRLKWGGLAAALVISFFGHIFGVSLLALGARSASGIPLIIILVAINFALKRRVAALITAGAAEN